MSIEQNNNGKRFHWRSFISIGLALSFFLMSISGIILYLAPPGRISRWIEWLMFGLSRSQWEDQHTLSSYLFLILAVIHLFSMNWKAFLSYLRNRIRSKRNRIKELLAASLLFILIFAFTLLRIPPIISVMDIGNNISGIWADRTSSPPVPHTEEMSIKDIALNIMDSSPDTIMVKIKRMGYSVENVDQTLKSIAIENGVAPSVIFDTLSSGFNIFRLYKRDE